MLIVIIMKTKLHNGDGFIKVEEFHNSVVIRTHEIVIFNLDKAGSLP